MPEIKEITLNQSIHCIVFLKKITNFLKSWEIEVKPDFFQNKQNKYTIENIHKLLDRNEYKNNIEEINFVLKDVIQINNQNFDFLKQNDNIKIQKRNIPAEIFENNPVIFKFLDIIEVFKNDLYEVIRKNKLNVPANKKQKIIKLLKKIDEIYKKLPGDFNLEKLEKEIKKICTSDDK